MIEERGAERVRLEDVAREAGCSRRAVYLHFPSRTSLLLALPAYIDEEEDLAGSIARIWDADSALEALDAFAAHVAGYQPRIAATVDAVDRARRVDDAAAALWQDRMRAWHDACRRLARWLEREGMLPAGWSVDEAADVLWSFMSVRLWWDLVVERGWSADRYGERLRDLFRAAVTTAPRATERDARRQPA